MKEIFFGVLAVFLGALSIVYGLHALVTGQTRHRILHPNPLWDAPPAVARMTGLLVVAIGVALIGRGLHVFGR